MGTFAKLVRDWERESLEETNKEARRFRGKIRSRLGWFCRFLCSLLPFLPVTKRICAQEKRFAAMVLVAAPQILESIQEYKRMFDKWEFENRTMRGPRAQTMALEQVAYARAEKITTTLVSDLEKAGNWRFWYRRVLTPKELIKFPYEGNVSIQLARLYWDSVIAHFEKF